MIESSETDYVIAISRSVMLIDESSDHETIKVIQCDYSEISITKMCEKIKIMMGSLYLDSITRMFICNSVLHNNEVSPEICIEDISINDM